MSKEAVELYLVRHAHAGDPAKWSGPDERRPLSAKGRQQAERLARHLAAIRPELDVILSSPKVRARETADPIAAALGMDVQIDDRLGGGLTLAALDEALTEAGDPAAAMIVGHDPDFSELAAELASADSLPMRKGALARFSAARPLRPGAAIVRWLIPPDALSGGREG
jgi:phosphohistidine phosphatase SixA